MHISSAVDTDLGRKEQNQDSALLKHAFYQGEEIFLGIICDGLGGLAQGELASATVVKAFSQWFDTRLPLLLKKEEEADFTADWLHLLEELNQRISKYGKQRKIMLGTTFTGLLLYKSQMHFVHIGDTRIYYLNQQVRQLTRDHTFVSREVRRGNMTPEEAKKSKRRNTLLQCVGASRHLLPQTGTSELKKGMYLLCSDGFRHEITEGEMLHYYNPYRELDEEVLHRANQHLIGLAKARKEIDNITVMAVHVK